ncbi:hypothetical protein G6O67_008402 [Ophiocordyceps sinensis]|uniref:Uncharacterized protein n=1 Tax=Ophiocordyceps sinensis TaxID=72228 RepID=A0A8H4LS94_9HYPO|nr:hypothetical protein G6O67_008402 [Ophiocordyceps sinensis]
MVLSRATPRPGGLLDYHEFSPDSGPEFEATMTRLVNDEYHHDFLMKRTLGLESLGRPVTVLILKNPDKIRERREPRPVLDNKSGPIGTPLSIGDALPKEEESESETLAQVMENLEELRPKDRVALSLLETKKLARALEYGFTREQLKSYLAARNSKPTELYSWIVKQELRKAARAESLSPKQQTISKIMNTWNVHVRGRRTGPDNLRVWLGLPRPVFDLLFSPSSPALRTLTAYCKQWRIIPSPTECQLKISAPEVIWRRILARIDKIIQSIMTQTVPFKSARKHSIPRTILDELERITNTSLRYKHSNSELSILWFADESIHQPNQGPEQESQRTEDRPNAVLRLLLAQQADQHPARVDIMPSFEREEPVDGFMAAVHHHRGDRALPWYHRMQKWSRHVYPASRRDYVKRPVRRTCLFEKLWLPTPFFKAGEASSTNRITATFGHVLHSGSKPVSGFNTMRRLLSPIIPHPAALSSFGLESDKPVVQATTIILNFSPEQGRKPSHGQASIRIQIPVDPDCDLSKLTLSPGSTLEGILAPWNVTDVLLPDERVDVRLAQQRVLRLDSDQPSLKEFLAMSEINLVGGHIKTPKRAYFSIPKNWRPARPRAIEPAESTKLVQSVTELVEMAKAVKSTKPAKTANEEARPDGEARPDEEAESLAQQRTDVPYLFVSLEVHQMVDVELDGCTLRYNSIEAGHGGQRQEISLSVSDCHSGEPEAANKTKSFLQVVENIAFGQAFPWHKGNRKNSTRQTRKKLEVLPQRDRQTRKKLEVLPQRGRQTRKKLEVLPQRDRQTRKKLEVLPQRDRQTRKKLEMLPQRSIPRPGRKGVQRSLPRRVHKTQIG